CSTKDGSSFDEYFEFW
nr:immunoglobulin heavy chain junction region [Macaca mulatta]MOX93289.1 immunoglobulin heavy chain junction region [Macaca mulatta]MOX93367.1 immunoglobulin heavy chain junction region [Macaca mulatta]MOX95036.1 immunoglobulin heavy chain junction region [Macaca mulatta]MOX95287.1 immunoglobulin heavy chain junction region [Macaca mulatta]